MEYLRAILSGVGVTDILDIAIISFIIYKILGYIHSTRAEQLAKGLLFLIAAYIISGAAHLYTLNWAMGKVLNIGLIALVIVFQPELRRGLELIGRRGRLSLSLSMFKDDKAASAAKYADEIVNAISYFSSVKEGALIVLERQTALNDIAESGTIIDAAITTEMLENIFYTGAPLHDGAVIIRGDRIYSAGCMLPLSENPNLSKDLGTRHRAGIGITEQSDALVFIVSEETGIISMVEDGRISRFLDIKTVEKNLLAHFMKKPADNAGLIQRPAAKAKEENHEE
ncbi:MAG: diadenylate cyclase CdaA [Firmicutes bacterium]|nr:diadenylate cyclase CdaA [Bacillota bacterium]MBR5926028.1 diadenylate cyclase CdaA [Bacillota bacterium]MBR6025491.1 diadenylate cyclase CdaA [Bacillota bacterium]